MKQGGTLQQFLLWCASLTILMLSANALPLRNDPPVNQLAVVIILGNMDQHAVPREELVVPQQVGVKAEDGNIIGQAAEHPAGVLPADDRLSPAANGVPVLRPDEGIGGGVPHRDRELPLTAAVLLQDDNQTAYRPPFQAAGPGIGHLKTVVVHTHHRASED